MSTLLGDSQSRVVMIDSRLIAGRSSAARQACAVRNAVGPDIPVKSASESQNQLSQPCRSFRAADCLGAELRAASLSQQTGGGSDAENDD